LGGKSGLKIGNRYGSSGRLWVKIVCVCSGGGNRENCDNRVVRGLKQASAEISWYGCGDRDHLHRRASFQLQASRQEIRISVQERNEVCLGFKGFLDGLERLRILGRDNLQQHIC
jgi:hypothetical protein